MGFDLESQRNLIIGASCLIVVLGAQILLLPRALGIIASFVYNRNDRLRQALRGESQRGSYLQVRSLYVFPIGGMVLLRKVVLSTSEFVVTAEELRVQLRWWKSIPEQMKKKDSLKHPPSAAKPVLGSVEHAGETIMHNAVVHVRILGAQVRLINRKASYHNDVPSSGSVATDNGADRESSKSTIAFLLDEQLSWISRFMELIIVDLHVASVMAYDPMGFSPILFTIESCRVVYRIEDAYSPQDLCRCVYQMRTRDMSLRVYDGDVIYMKAGEEFVPLKRSTWREWAENRTRVAWPGRTIFSCDSATVLYYDDKPGMEKEAGTQERTYPKSGAIVNLENGMFSADTQFLYQLAEAQRRLNPPNFEDLEVIDTRNAEPAQRHSLGLKVELTMHNAEKQHFLEIPYTPQAETWAPERFMDPKHAEDPSLLALYSGRVSAEIFIPYVAVDKQAVTKMDMKATMARIVSHGALNCPMVDAETMTVAAKVIAGPGWNSEQHVSVDTEFSAAHALYLTDYMSVITDFFGGMKPRDAEADAKWFVPSTFAGTLRFVEGYEIGLGAEYANVWSDLWSALDPIPKDWLFRWRGRKALASFSTRSDELTPLSIELTYKLDLGRSTVHLVGPNPVGRSSMASEELKFDEKVVELPGQFTIEGHNKIYTRKLTDSIDNLKVQMRANPYLMAVGSPHVPKFVNFIINYFGVAAHVVDAGLTSHGAGSQGQPQHNRDWKYYKELEERASRYRLNPAKVDVSVEFRSASLTLVPHVHESWSVRVPSVNSMGEPVTPTAVFPLLEVSKFTFSLVADDERSMMKIDFGEEISLRHNGSMKFPRSSSRVSRHDTLAFIESLQISREINYEDQNPYLSIGKVHVGSISGALDLKSAIGLADFVGSMSMATLPSSEGYTVWQLAMETLSVLEIAVRESHFRVLFGFRESAHLAAFIAEVSWGGVTYLSADLATQKFLTRTTIDIESVTATVLFVLGKSRRAEAAREVLTIEPISASMETEFRPFDYSSTVADHQRKALQRADRRKQLLAHLWLPDKEINLMLSKHPELRWIEAELVYRSEGSEPVIERPEEQSTIARVFGEVQIKVGEQFLKGTTYVVEQMVSQRKSATAEEALAELWAETGKQDASPTTLAPSSIAKTRVIVPSVVLMLLADDVQESGVSEFGVRFPKGIAWATEIRRQEGATVNSQSLLAPEFEVYAVRDDLEHEEELVLISLLTPKSSLRTLQKDSLGAASRVALFSFFSAGAMQAPDIKLADLTEVATFVAEWLPYFQRIANKLGRLRREQEARKVVAMKQAVGCTFEEFRSLDGHVEKRTRLFVALATLRSENHPHQCQLCDRLLAIIVTAPTDDLPRVPPEKSRGQNRASILLPLATVAVEGREIVRVTAVSGLFYKSAPDNVSSLDVDAFHISIGAEVLARLTTMIRNVTRVYEDSTKRLLSLLQEQAGFVESHDETNQPHLLLILRKVHDTSWYKTETAVLSAANRFTIDRVFAPDPRSAEPPGEHEGVRFATFPSGRGPPFARQRTMLSTVFGGKERNPDNEGGSGKLPARRNTQFGRQRAFSNMFFRQRRSARHRHAMADPVKEEEPQHLIFRVPEVPKSHFNLLVVVKSFGVAVRDFDVGMHLILKIRSWQTFVSVHQLDLVTINVGLQRVCLKFKHEPQKVIFEADDFTGEVGYGAIGHSGEKAILLLAGLGRSKLGIRSLVVQDFARSFDIAQRRWSPLFTGKLNSSKAQKRLEGLPASILSSIIFEMDQLTVEVYSPVIGNKVLRIVAGRTYVNMSLSTDDAGKLSGSTSFYSSGLTASLSTLHSDYESPGIDLPHLRLITLHETEHRGQAFIVIEQTSKELALERVMQIVTATRKLSAEIPRSSRRVRNSAHHRQSIPESLEFTIRMDIESQSRRVLARGLVLALDLKPMRCTIKLDSGRVWMDLVAKSWAVSLGQVEGRSESKVAIENFVSKLTWMMKPSVPAVNGVQLVSYEAVAESAVLFVNEDLLQCARDFTEECQFLDANDSNQFDLGNKQESEAPQVKADSSLAVQADTSLAVQIFVSISLSTTRIVAHSEDSTVFLRLRRSSLKGHFGDYVLVDMPSFDANSARQRDSVVLALDNHLVVAQFSKAELIASRAGTVGILGSSVMTIQKRDTELRVAVEGGGWELLLSTALMKSVYTLVGIFKVELSDGLPSKAEPAKQPSRPGSLDIVDVDWRLNTGQIKFQGAEEFNFPSPKIAVSFYSEKTRGSDVLCVEIEGGKIRFPANLVPAARGLVDLVSEWGTVQPARATEPVAVDEARRQRASGGRPIDLFGRLGPVSIEGQEELVPGLTLGMNLNKKGETLIFGRLTGDQQYLSGSLPPVSLTIAPRLPKAKHQTLKLNYVRVLVAENTTIADLGGVTVNADVRSLLIMKEFVAQARESREHVDEQKAAPISSHGGPSTDGVGFPKVMILGAPVKIALDLERPKGTLGVQVDRANVVLDELGIRGQVEKLDARFRWELVNGSLKFGRFSAERLAGGRISVSIADEEMLCIRDKKIVLREVVDHASYFLERAPDDGQPEEASGRSLVFVFGKAETRVSSMFVPAVKRVVGFMSRLTSESAQEGRKLLRERGFSTVVHTKWDDQPSSKVSKSVSSSKTRKLTAASDRSRPREGTVTIIGDALKCSLCRYALYEESSLWLEMGNVALNYSQTCEMASFERTVGLLFGSVRILIKNRRLVGISRPVTLALVTQEDDSVLRVDFSSQFESAVEISSSLSQYKELTEIVRHFLSSGPDGEDQRPAAQQREEFIAAASDNRGQSSEPLRIMQGRKLHGRNVVFKRIDFSPRLRALGELTPNLDTVLGWLDLGGIETIPLAGYEYLSIPTGKLLGTTTTEEQPPEAEANPTA